MKTYSLIAFGCDKNIIDAECMAKRLADAGYRFSPSVEESDIIVVHTCAFIDAAKNESIDAILEMAQKKNSGASLIVTGCLAQRYSKEIANEITEVDLILGVGQHNSLLDRMGSERICVSEPEAWDITTFDRIPSTPPYYAYVKISEGCDNRCSYCAIPQIRGRQRSRPVGAIIEEISRLEKQGLVELNLVAQDLTAYGTDTGQYNLVGLLDRIINQTHVPWIRLLYLHPARVTDELIAFIAGERRILPYLDIPVQHASDAILRSMGRKITKSDIVRLIDRLRSRIDDLILRTTVIIGYPGEGEGEFRELSRFVSEARFERLGAFMYSPEKDTAAYRLHQRVPKKIKKRRYDDIMHLQQEISLDYHRSLIGRRLKTLVCGVGKEGGEYFWGRYFGQAPDIDGVIYFSGQNLREGDLVSVLVTDCGPYDLMGEAV